MVLTLPYVRRMEELKAYLKLNGIKIADFAEMLGCKRDTIQKWLAGITRPNYFFAARIEIITKGAVTRLHWYPEFK